MARYVQRRVTQPCYRCDGPYASKRVYLEHLSIGERIKAVCEPCWGEAPREQRMVTEPVVYVR